MRSTTLLAAALVLLAAGCKDDQKQDAPKPAATPEPIPSDIVYNSFFAQPNATADLKVAFDGGLLGGDAGSAAAASPGDGAGKAKLLDAGGEPKSKLVYAFAMGKATTVVATVSASTTGGDQPPFKFTYAATAKTHTPDGMTHFEVKVSKAEVMVGPGSPPELAAQKGMIEKLLSGLEGGFDASAQGDVQNVSIATDKVPRAAQQLLPIFAQTMEFLVVAVPSAPVGIGAKWATTSRDEEAGATLESTYTLVSHDGNAFEVKADTTRNAPKRAYEDPQAPPGTMIEIKGSGSYTIDLRLDGVASKASGSGKTSVVVSAPGQGSQTQTVTQTQTLESK